MEDKRKVHFDIIIPEEFDIGEVIIYKNLTNKKREEMHPSLIEDFEHGYNTCPEEDEEDDDDDDPDWQPGIDEDDESEPDPYEHTPLTEDEKAMLKQELKNLILDQELDLELEWEEYKNEDD